VINPEPRRVPDVAHYLRVLREEFPRLRLVEKERDWFSKLIAFVLRIVTMGGQSTYLTQYVTTLGQTIYLPSGWSTRSETSKYIVLRHEAVHLRQFRRFTFIGMAFLYLVPFLPVGLAYGRARLEWEAYAETLRVVAEVHGLEQAQDAALQQHIVDQFCKGGYGWMWPFPRVIRRWIDACIAEIE